MGCDAIHGWPHTVRRFSITHAKLVALYCTLAQSRSVPQCATQWSLLRAVNLFMVSSGSWFVKFKWLNSIELTISNDDHSRKPEENAAGDHMLLWRTRVLQRLARGEQSCFRWPPAHWETALLSDELDIKDSLYLLVIDNQSLIRSTTSVLSTLGRFVLFTSYPWMVSTFA